MNKEFKFDEDNKHHRAMRLVKVLKAFKTFESYLEKHDASRG
jgi:hypothetical protein